MDLHIFHAKVAQVTNEWSTSAREGKRKSPECPLKRADGHDCECLEDHGKSRLPASHATIKKTDTGNNDKDEAAHNDLVDIFPFEADILRIDVDLLWITAVGNAGIEGGLCSN